MFIPINGGRVFVCESCADGKHISYGVDHRTGPPGHRDCKNLSPDGQGQCACNPEWEELAELTAEAINKQRGNVS
jgi:hypothetical protein